MASPPFNIDQTKPADTDAVSAFPANERTNRDIIESMFAVEHDVASGQHKIGVGSTATRNAITTWVVGSLWFNTSAVPAVLQRVVSIGPVVWEDVSATDAAFRATVGSQQNNVTGNNVEYTIVADTEEFDRGADYNASTGVFTARRTGLYVLGLKVHMLGLTGHDAFSARIYINSVNRVVDQGGAVAQASVAGTLITGGNELFPMTAGQTADFRIQVTSGAQVVDIGTATTVWGFRVL